ncbi:MAG: hypothetical protein H7Z11_11595 [Verrucomicrobia bacterium]|nr:hypothetical protein [Leptolyngbya sp. ES-bin-22]
MTRGSILFERSPHASDVLPLAKPKGLKRHNQSTRRANIASQTVKRA